ncbi:MAG: nickel pincer cofactor biosynthesis protein LarB [Hadesarchaea archaeon]|nr:MAG: nickel pincer cofactor biosynthesis protein LarB [Hadesarchaea archaeon]
MGAKSRKELITDVEGVLNALLAGKLTVGQAKRKLAALNIKRIGDLARLDVERIHRVGIPEVVLAEGKNPETVAKAAVALASTSGYSLVTRASKEHLKLIQKELRKDFEVEHNSKARTVVVRKKGHRFPTRGKIGVLAAGTADVPVAEEAAVSAEVMGCEVLKAYDVGVAGIHRLFEPLKHMVEQGVAAIVVVAGMEGTLPSLVSSLVDVPVIGVPTSIGYGVGLKGIGALMTMLQTCSPKIAVVNIDNGFGGGVFAASIAKQSKKK